MYPNILNVSKDTLRSLDIGEICLKKLKKQIGNAVPVNLAYAVGRAVVRLLNQIEIADSSDIDRIAC